MTQFNPQYCRSEGDVESKLIVQYLLPALGYSHQDWHQQVTFGRIRLDFLAFATQILPFRADADSPLALVIEAKAPWQNLDRHVHRLKQYLTGINVRLGILTNGHELRVYQRSGNKLTVLFQCAGENISDKIEEIKALVGKESIKDKLQPATKVENTQQKNKTMKTIAIYHNKGGVGKTTVAVNLAAALRRRNKRVLLVDLDSQANSTFATGLVKFFYEDDDTIKDRNVYHVLESGDFNFIPDVARKSDFFNTPELSVIPSHINLIEWQHRINQVTSSKTRLFSKLNHVKDDYDFVIIDTPPSRDFYAQVALIAADYLIIPSDLKPFANQGLSSVQELLKEINEFRGILGKSAIKILGVLPSKISTSRRFLDRYFDEQKNTVMKKYELPVFDSVIYERVALSHSLNQTIVAASVELPDPKSIFAYADMDSTAGTAAEEFEKLTDEVLRKIQEASAQ